MRTVKVRHTDKVEACWHYTWHGATWGFMREKGKVRLYLHDGLEAFKSVRLYDRQYAAHKAAMKHISARAEEVTAY
jgi:hypothetical protein